MPPAEVIALTDEIHARLEHGEFAGLGPIAVEGGMFLPDAQVVARILLADVEDWAVRESWDHVSPPQWNHLTAQLRGFLHEVEQLRAAHVSGLESRPDEAASPSIVKRFELALRRSPIIVYSQDTELRYTWIYNPHPDFMPESIIGKTDAAFYQPDEFERLRVIKQRVMDTGVGTRETVLVTMHDTPTYYDLTVEPLYDAHGMIIGVTGAATDITAFKHAEQALAQSEAQLNEAQHVAQIGSWEWNAVTEQVTMQDLLELRRLVGNAPPSDVTEFPAEGSERTPD